MGTYGKLMELSQSSRVETAEAQQGQSGGFVAPIARLKKSPKENEAEPHGIVIPRHHETMVPRYRDTTIEVIRSAVKVFGKEAATHRFTPEEKRAIKEVVFAYEQRGMRTGENEISRIGVNFLIEDYKLNGESSVLHKALKALNS